MAVYQWTGKDKKGKIQKGEMEAASEQAVKSHLSRLHITPSRVKEKPKDIFENVAFLQPKVVWKRCDLICQAVFHND